MAGNTVDSGATDILDVLIVGAGFAGVGAAMTPDYPAGCKRLLIADNFYEAMNRPNVRLVTAAISAIETDAIITADGDRHPADIIVYATGFDLENYMRQTGVTGPGGTN